MYIYIFICLCVFLRGSSKQGVNYTFPFMLNTRLYTYICVYIFNIQSMSLSRRAYAPSSQFKIFLIFIIFNSTLFCFILTN